MTTFPTPEPIELTFDLVGDVRIEASDRQDTVVTVLPHDPAKAADVRAAEQVEVECRDGRLLVKAQRSWRHYTPFGGNHAVAVTVELPTGSSVSGESGFGNIIAEGSLGECRVKTAMGDIRVQRTAALRAVTGFGAVTADRVLGHAEIKTGSGAVRAHAIDGTAEIKNSNGETMVGDVTGDLRVKAANGNISVRRARSSAVAKTALGDVRVDEVRHGTVVLETSTGEVEVGIRGGTAALLDANTRFGRVHSTLADVPGPPPTGDRVEVRARTSMGDIVIGRSTVADDADPSDDPGNDDPNPTDDPTDDDRSDAR
jgi:hypothetical protein